MDVDRWLNGPIGLLLLMLSGLFWLVVLIRGLVLVAGPRPVTPTDALWTISVVMAAAAASVLELVLLQLGRLLEGRGWKGGVGRRLGGGLRVMQGSLALLLAGFLIVVSLGAVPGWGSSISWMLLTMRLGVAVVASVVPGLVGIWGWRRLWEGVRRMG